MNEQQCYITLGWKGLSGTNTLAYWDINKLQRKRSVVNAATGTVY